MIKHLVLTLAVALVSQSAFTEVISCSANLTGFDPGSSMRMDVSVNTDRLTATTIGHLSNGLKDKIDYKNVLVKGPFDIRKTDGFSDSNNEGEQRIAHLKELLKEKEISDKIALSFDVKDVKRVILYDIDEVSRDQGFGGFVLVEAYGANNKYLGRFISSILVSECK